MEDKIINIPFNRQQFETRQRFIGSIAYKKNIRGYTFYAIIGLMLLLGGIFTSQGNAIGAGWIGGVMLFFVFAFWSGVWEKQANFRKLIHQKALLFEEEQMDCTYIFSDYGIEYYDKEKMFKLKWRLLKPFTVYQDHIMISLKDSNSISYVLSKAELGEADYNEVYDILKSKIKEAVKRGRLIS